MKTFGFQWHITNQCNLKCGHCYQTDFSKSKNSHLNDLIKMADKIFSNLSKRPIDVNITGGEPLLHAHLFELIEHLVKYDNLKEINIITN